MGVERVFWREDTCVQERFQATCKEQLAYGVESLVRGQVSSAIMTFTALSLSLCLSATSFV